MKKDTVVLGLGNPLLSDEGIGCFLIEQFLKKSHNYPDVDFIDAGTGGMAVLHLIENRKKAFIIDCAYMQTQPGTIKKFSPNEIKSVKKLKHFSLHEADIIKVIEISKQLNSCPDVLIFFGIEPQVVAPGQNLSKTLTEKTDRYMEFISTELIN